MSVDHDDFVEDHTKGKSPELCVNTDCERYPPQDEEEEWVKCTLCDGFFNDDGEVTFYTLKKSQIIKQRNVTYVVRIVI